MGAFVLAGGTGEASKGLRGFQASVSRASRWTTSVSRLDKITGKLANFTGNRQPASHRYGACSRDLQVGIVSLPDGRHDIRGLLRVLRSNSSARQGLSPVFDDLVATTGANRLARSALLGAVRGAEHVVMFDDAPLQMTSVAAPDINLRIARSVLSGLDPLPPTSVPSYCRPWVHGATAKGRPPGRPRSSTCTATPCASGSTVCKR